MANRSMDGKRIERQKVAEWDHKCQRCGGVIPRGCSCYYHREMPLRMYYYWCDDCVREANKKGEK